MRCRCKRVADSRLRCVAPFACPQNLKALRKHFAARHGGAKHACEACGAHFGRSDLLSRHRKMCQQPGRIACVCAPTTTFQTVFNLNRHIRARAAAAPAELHARCEVPEAAGAAAAAAHQDAGAASAEGAAGAEGGPPAALAAEARPQKDSRRRRKGHAAPAS
jgi:hypothetical protein